MSGKTKNKDPRLGVEYKEKTKQVFEYLDKGLTIEESYKLVYPNKELKKQNGKLLQRKYDDYSLANPKTVKKAAKVIDKILSGKPLNNDKDNPILPKDSTIFQAAKEVMDRQDPKVSVNHNLNVNADISPVDLSKYLNKK